MTNIMAWCHCNHLEYPCHTRAKEVFQGPICSVSASCRVLVSPLFLSGQLQTHDVYDVTLRHSSTQRRRLYFGHATLASTDVTKVLTRVVFGQCRSLTALKSHLLLLSNDSLFLISCYDGHLHVLRQLHVFLSEALQHRLEQTQSTVNSCTLDRLQEAEAGGHCIARSVSFVSFFCIVESHLEV
ncbi:hypothetical protein BR93DRAFT_150031 [Coniochaeta sp. PMI_546]|nr:hypothetical protein BR93DRAFT_150031 [Coniochaeta sp. PMI_546]